VKRIWSDLNPTLRGFLIIALIALVIVILQLQATLSALFILARIAFFLAIAFFCYLLWRERRSEISEWPQRAKAVFYGAALLMVVDLGVWFVRGGAGLDALAFILVLLIGGFSMWRVWRDEHTYGY
jgi:ABC-type nickel/cobalt efflux system permease component RcnA